MRISAHQMNASGVTRLERNRQLSGGGQGIPKDIVRAARGHTTRYLQEVLDRRPIKKGKATQREAAG